MTKFCILVFEIKALHTLAGIHQGWLQELYQNLLEMHLLKNAYFFYQCD